MEYSNMLWTLADDDSSGGRPDGSTDGIDSANKGPEWLGNLRYGRRTLVVDEELGPDEVLVRMHAASLNARDLVIAKGALPACQPSQGVIAGSDGAGSVVAVGRNVDAFRPCDDVIMHMVPFVSDDYLPRMQDISDGLGQTLNGTLCELAIFPCQSLVHMPATMTYEQAATLGCSGLTAWNALMGLRGREVKPGDYVLIQGTGGVSIAALQFAVAAGATVVATTSQEAKFEHLVALGASHIINYRSDAAWGKTARALTPESRGFDHIIDVGGADTLRHSFDAVRTDGLVSLVGVLGAGKDKTPDVLTPLWSVCIVRGVLLGSKAMLRDMIEFCKDKGIEPALDFTSFPLADAADAYRRLDEQKHFAKVVINIP